MSDVDPVVKELDMFLAHGLADSAYLLQLPLQNTREPTGLEQATGCRLKPARKRMEVDISMDTECSNFDRDSKFHSDTRTLQSTLIPSHANYAVGTLRGNELHITPLHAVLQLRPSFQKVDERDAKLEAEKGAKVNEPAAEVDASGTPQLYQVTIKRAETERTLERRQKSHAYLAREELAQAWIPMELHQPDSKTAVRIRQKLFADGGADGRKLDAVSVAAYFDLLLPTEADGANCEGVGDFSMHALGEMPLPERVLALLARVQIIQYEWLTSVLGAVDATEAPDEAQVLEILEREASLLHGCWVLNSARACAADGKDAGKDAVRLAAVRPRPGRLSSLSVP
jgi:DNA-directed RNA polymerase-3 subunit RPC5